MTDRLKQETFATLQGMGYNYILINKAYNRSNIKTTEGVMNYILSHPELQTEVTQELSEQEASLLGGDSKSGGISKSANYNNLYEQLLLMGFEDYLIEASLAATNARSVDSAMDWISKNRSRVRKPGSKAGTRGVKKPNARSGKNTPGGTRRNYNTRNSKKVEKPAPRAGGRKNTGGRTGGASGRGGRRPTGRVPKSKPASKYSKNDINPIAPEPEDDIDQPKTEAGKVYSSSGVLGGDNRSEFGVYDPTSRPKFVADSKPTNEKSEAQKRREEQKKKKEEEQRRQAILKNVQKREKENRRLGLGKQEGMIEKKPLQKKAKNPPEQQRKHQMEMVSKPRSVVVSQQGARKTKHQVEAEEKERARKDILKQLAIDKAKRFGRPVDIDDDEDRPPTVLERFEAIYAKMVAIYPIRTKKAKILQVCLKTAGIYISKTKTCSDI